MELEAKLNGQAWKGDCAPGESLLSTLRRQGIHGPKKGCESGDCGCCTVWLNGEAIQSCLCPAYRAEGQEITTIEGLAPAGEVPHPVQAAFLQEEGFQCGYCTAGMIMTCAGSNAAACADLGETLKGNICRCTGWGAIQRACGAVGAAEPVEPPAHGGRVGEAVPNRHGPAIVTGHPSFTADFPEKEMLHLAVVRSPHPHARIVGIDASEALAVEGVVQVFTHRDIKRIPYTTACHPAVPRDAFDTYLLDDTVRFVGQRVAVVAAESRLAALRARDLVKVDYELLPFVTTAEEAMRPGAPVVHPEPESYNILDPQRNLIGIFERRRGDLAKGLAEADVVVETVVETPRQQHAHLEPHISTSWLDKDGGLIIRSSTQVPFLTRRTLAHIFELPEEKIRVFKPRVGGGFGNKQEVQTEDLCTLVTLKTGRPAQLEFSRHDEFTATSTRHPMRLVAKAGARADGTLTAVSLEYVSNTGAYGNHSFDVLECAAFEAMAVLRCDHKYINARAIYTNTMPAGAFRGYGATQTSYVIECLMDDLADRLGMDPLAFRRKNLVRPGDILAVSDQEDPDHRLGSYALDACLDHIEQALQAAPLPAADADWLHGQGIGVAGIGSGLAKIHVSGARIELKEHGYRLCVGSADIGTGSDTTLAQIAAEALGADFSQIEIHTGDTGGAPEDSGAYASATAYIAGRAVQDAAQRLRDMILKTASLHVGEGAETLRLTADAVIGESRSLSLAKLWKQAEAEGATLVGEVEGFAQDRVSFSFAAVGAQVRVHRRTGRVELTKCVQAVDAGRLLNPRICQGQAEGATVQSIGYTLMEGLVVQPDGAIQNPNFRDYRVPALDDLPAIETQFFEADDEAGPFGAKALGELTSNAVPPAIANAVKNALGRRIPDLPITPEKCWRALQPE